MLFRSLYLSQLMGLAFGMGEDAMQLKKNITLTKSVRENIGNKGWSQPDLTGSEEELAEVGL